MITLVQKFNFYQIKIISVSEGIITDGLQLKERDSNPWDVQGTYLDDLKKKTMRVLRGYSFIQGLPKGWI